MLKEELGKVFFTIHKEERFSNERIITGQVDIFLDLRSRLIISHIHSSMLSSPLGKTCLILLRKLLAQR